MRAFYLSIFLMIFFATFSLFTGFSEFAGFDPDYGSVGDGNISLSEENINEELNTMKDESYAKMEQLRSDNNILTVLSTVLYGLKMIFSIIINTVRYALFFADVLILWGAPLMVASFVQTMIYISYVITLFQMFGVKK